jgi:hypothetical protein
MSQRGAMKGLDMQRDVINDAIAEGVEKASAGGGTALREANKRYSGLATASKILDKETARNQANRSVSLTDTIAGGAGLAAGGPVIGAIAGAANKAGRAVGNAVMARGADAAANVFGKTPSLVAFARNNPMLASAIAGRISQPGGFETEHFQELQDPKVLGIFKQNPELIESVVNPKLKAAIMKRLSQSGAENQNRKPSDK